MNSHPSEALEDSALERTLDVKRPPSAQAWWLAILRPIGARSVSAPSSPKTRHPFKRAPSESATEATVSHCSGRSDDHLHLDTVRSRTDTIVPGGKREIRRGTTCDSGATFNWTPVTANSTKDNVRPIVPRPRGRAQ